MDCGKPCQCKKMEHDCKLIVLTGGPGAGKTAVLEVGKRSFCEHIAILPESASIVFGGGFPRKESIAARKGSQRAIFHVQKELEQVIIEEHTFAIALCDRGTLDGLAYWPEEEKTFFEEMKINRLTEFERYHAVIHLRTPTEQGGYNRSNPIRTETSEQAAEIDKKILKAWEGHPRRFIVENTENFLQKAEKVINFIQAELPDCCKGHAIQFK